MNGRRHAVPANCGDGDYVVMATGVPAAAMAPAVAPVAMAVVSQQPQQTNDAVEPHSAREPREYELGSSDHCKPIDFLYCTVRSMFNLDNR